MLNDIESLATELEGFNEGLDKVRPNGLSAEDMRKSAGIRRLYRAARELTDKATNAAVIAALRDEGNPT